MGQPKGASETKQGSNGWEASEQFLFGQANHTVPSHSYMQMMRQNFPTLGHNGMLIQQANSAEIKNLNSLNAPTQDMFFKQQNEQLNYQNTSNQNKLEKGKLIQQSNHY